MFETIVYWITWAVIATSIVGAAVIACIGAGVCFYGARKLWRDELRARRFLPLTATIAGTRIHEEPGGDNDISYYPELVLTWKVRGATYERDTKDIRNIRQGYPTRMAAERALNKMKRSELVDIVYNHEDPFEVRLAHRYQKLPQLIASAGIIPIALGLVFIFFPFF